jgi:DNA repair ATPase RecN
LQEAHPQLKNVRTFVVLKHLKRSLAIPLSILTGTSGAGA